MKISQRKFQRLKKQHLGGRRSELHKREQLALKTYLQEKLQEPGVTTTSLYKAVKRDWGLGYLAAKRYLSAIQAEAASKHQEPECFSRKDLQKVRAKWGGRKTAFPEALESTRRFLELEEAEATSLKTATCWTTSPRSCKKSSGS